MNVPQLQGARVRLEPLSRVHSPGMFALWREPRVCEFSGPAEDSAGQPIPLPAESSAHSDRLLQYWLDRSRAGTGFRWAVLAGSPLEFAGAVGFNSLGRCAEYACHFIPRFWGVGLATEAARLALSWAFDAGTERVELFIEPANSPSLRLATGLGFARDAGGGDEELRYVMERPPIGSGMGGNHG